MEKKINDRIIKCQIDEYGFFYILSYVTYKGITINSIKTIIDTGAAYTHIHPNLAREFRLDKINIVNSTNPINGREKLNEYEIDILIKMFNIPNVKVREFKDVDYPCGIILGIDILKHCDFRYKALTKSFSLTVLPNV